MLQEKDFKKDGDMSWYETTLSIPEEIILSVPKTDSPFEDALPKIRAFYSKFLANKTEIHNEAGKMISKMKGVSLSSEEILETIVLFDVSIYADDNEYMATLLYKDSKEVLEGKNIEVRLGTDLQILEVGLAG